MSRHRNSTLDVLKLFASYMVVFIHVLFYGQVGVVFDALARFAVPLFFLVSGFYSYQITPQKAMRRVPHLLQLLLSAVVIYTCYNMLAVLLKGNAQDIVLYFKDYIVPRNLIKLFLFNKPVHTSHLWYLLAAVYVYCVYALVILCKLPEKLVYILSAIALLLHLFLGEICTALNIAVPIPLIRNFALMGFPFFMLGTLLKKHYDKFAKLPNYLILVFLILGVSETLLSRYFFGKNELYLGSIFMLFAFCLVFVKFPNTEYPPVLSSITVCSTYIYIFHPVISSVMRQAYEFIGFDYTASVALQMIHPPLVCVASTVFAYILVQITNKLKKR